MRNTKNCQGHAVHPVFPQNISSRTISASPVHPQPLGTLGTVTSGYHLRQDEEGLPGNQCFGPATIQEPVQVSEETAGGHALGWAA